MRVNRHLLIVLLVGMLSLVGCAAPPAPDTTSETSPAGTSPAETASAEQENPEASSIDCEAGFVLFESALLASDPLCIPEDPQRIIALNGGTMVNLLALGITPVGVVDYGARDFFSYLDQETLGEIASVGTPDGPNVESMLAMNPDLILGMAGNLDEELLADLQQLVPVALSATTSADWEQHLLFVGDAVQMGDAAQEMAAATDSRLADFREAYEPVREDETIAIIRSRADNFNIYSTETFVSELAKEAGLVMPDSFSELERRNSMSLESLPMLTSDRLFVMIRNEREAGAIQDLIESPLWQTLPAAENDQVELVNWSVWVAGWNVVGANLVIDDFYFYMLDQQPPTPNPFTDLVADGFGPAFDEERIDLE